MDRYLGPVRLTPARITAAVSFLSSILALGANFLLLPRDPLGLDVVREAIAEDSCVFRLTNRAPTVPGSLLVTVRGETRGPLRAEAWLSQLRLECGAPREDAHRAHEFPIARAFSDSGPVAFSWTAGEPLRVGVGGLQTASRTGLGWVWHSASEGRSGDSEFAEHTRRGLFALAIILLAVGFVAAWKSPVGELERREVTIRQSFYTALDETLPHQRDDVVTTKARLLLEILVVERVQPMSAAIERLEPITAKHLAEVTQLCRKVKPEIEAAYLQAARVPLQPLGVLERMVQ